MIDNLEVGEYTLKLRLPNQEYQSISITVHKGKEWKSDFILKKNSLIESETRINSMIYIDKIEKSNENRSVFKLQEISLKKLESIFTHVNSIHFSQKSYSNKWVSMLIMNTKQMNSSLENSRMFIWMAVKLVMRYCMFWIDKNNKQEWEVCCRHPVY